MTMKQTAVEWLINQINNALIDYTEYKISASIFGIRVTEYKQRAKEMEKGQIIDAWEDGSYGGGQFTTTHETSSEYYTSTYGNKGSDENKQ